jgi:hypothetical protein
MFLGCLVAHMKICTVDVISLRGWLHDPICKLCDIHLEMIQNLCQNYTFTIGVQGSVLAFSDLPCANNDK